jgi:glycosyltransferase involved in cell wall biosynthesis
MPPLVSVIIPTYNCAPYLSEAIDSVLLQAGVNMEIIVVDDGSTDNTKEVVEKYGDRITYISQVPGRGASAARNLGIQHASGEWIAFQDADDIWFPEKLAKQLDAIQSYPHARLVFADTLVSRNSVVIQDSLMSKRLKNWCERNTTQISDVYCGNVYRELLFGNYICTITVLLHRNALDQAGIFDETLKVGEDYDLWLRIARDHPAIYVDRVFCAYRVRDNGLSGGLEARSPRWLEAHTVVREKHLRSHWVPAQHYKVLTGVLSNNYWVLGMNYFREAQFKEARVFFLKGLGYHPLSLKNWFLYCGTFLPLSVIASMRSAKHVMKIW